MNDGLGPAAQLRPFPTHAAWRRRKLFRRLAELGWERMSSAFALPVPGDSADYRGVRLSPGTVFSTQCQGKSKSGTRSLTLRTLDLDFELVGRNRLRSGGVNQRLYSLGHALHGQELEPGVLLAEGWIRARDFSPQPTLSVIEDGFRRVEKNIEWIDRSLVRFRVAAWEPHDAY